MEIRLLTHNGEDYDKMIALRTEVLRKPLGLFFTLEQLEAESMDWFIGAFEGDILVGCCVLSRTEEKPVLQLRQMAVHPNLQQSGIGSAIVRFAENTALKNGFPHLMLHARLPAVPFYKRLNFRSIGGTFTEVGIPHQEMRKNLIPKE